MKIKIRPELKDVKYWVHLGLIDVLFMGTLAVIRPDLANLANAGILFVMLSVYDIAVHTILQID